MENIKCQSQFCTLKKEGFLTLRWLAQPLLFYSFFSFELEKKMKILISSNSKKRPHDLISIKL